MTAPYYVNVQVTWTSQAAGYEKTKTGTIVAIVPAGRLPTSYVPADMTLASWPGMPRNHESYLVRVGRSKALYWPRVSALAKVTQ